MSVDRYTKFISEQVRKEGGYVAEDAEHTKHFEKANDLEHNGRSYSSKHEFTSPHDHKTIVKMYRNHIKQATPDTHSRLTRADTFSHKGTDDTDFNSHSSNLERRGHNVVHNIYTEKTANGFKHTISQRENDDR